MDKNFLADRPISKKEDDKFQRYGFAKRIAETIVNRENEDCIAIGIYGAWGEGKTSVINFIETELEKNKNIIIVKFNPWIYNDEKTLLIQFFQKLALSLKANLKKEKEQIGELLIKYGKLLSVDIPWLGNIGETLTGVGEVLAEVDLETLKERIGTLLKKNKRKVVVFVDDIDRLDKTEIQSVFRIVKLTADFSNTIYVLSFDEKMVSAAIGEKFAEGNQKAGQNFLEKIIQVPLKIPVAQPDALKEFCFQLIQKAIDSNNLRLKDEEARRFVSEFTENILIKLDTPRLAVRYGNTLSFSLPLLFGEVNIVDLMLIEAIIIFYPNHYEFIKANPEYFIGSYNQTYATGKDNDKVNWIKEQMTELGKDLSRKQKVSIQDLLEELFPRINEAFRNHGHHEGNMTSWYKSKRIVSPKYFNRYFSYAVIKGEISDVAFNDFILNISNQDEDATIKSIRTLIKQSSPDTFLYKLRSIEDTFNWETAVKLTKAIALISELFIKYKGSDFMFGFQSPHAQAAIFIYQLLKKHDNKEEQFAHAKELLTKAIPTEFALELNRWFSTPDTSENKIFTKEQYNELTEIIINRALKDSGKLSIIEKFSDKSSYIFMLWAENNKEKLTKYINKVLNGNPLLCVSLLKVFTQDVYSSISPKPYKVNFSNEQYKFFTSLFDKDFIKECINKNFSNDEIKKEEIKWEDHSGPFQTDLNIVRQFLHWYDKDIQA